MKTFVETIRLVRARGNQNTNIPKQINCIDNNFMEISPLSFTQFYHYNVSTSVSENNFISESDTSL